MKLTYRGNGYKVLASTQFGSGSTDQPSRLIYRGHIYDYTPSFMAVSKAVATDAPTVTLTYRGNVYERQLHLPELYQNPRAINWRYQVFGRG